jgi:endonuclease YncB( thermonuclease family)
MRRKLIVRLSGAVFGVALVCAGPAGAADPPAQTPVVEARVSKINDGDSIEVDTTDGTHVRVRLSAIDTPEYDQPYGAESSAA